MKTKVAIVIERADIALGGAERSVFELAAALGDAPAAVNSLHHQAVAEPGAGLRASAVAEDGLIEAVEATDGSFALGVQWHPEKMDGPHRTRLFEAFAAACR